MPRLYDVKTHFAQCTEAVAGTQNVIAISWVQTMLHMIPATCRNTASCRIGVCSKAANAAGHFSRFLKQMLSKAATT